MQTILETEVFSLTRPTHTKSQSAHWIKNLTSALKLLMETNETAGLHFQHVIVSYLNHYGEVAEIRGVVTRVSFKSFVVTHDSGHHRIHMSMVTSLQIMDVDPASLEDPDLANLANTMINHTTVATATQLLNAMYSWAMSNMDTKTPADSNEVRFLLRDYAHVNMDELDSMLIQFSIHFD